MSRADYFYRTGWMMGACAMAVWSGIVCMFAGPEVALLIVFLAGPALGVMGLFRLTKMGDERPNGDPS